MKIVAIHQPSYLPWFGILDKIARCDLFVVLDSVQYNKRAFQHRTLYSHTKEAKYLSLAVNAKNHQQTGLQIMDVTLSDCTLPAKHLQTLRHRYGRRPGWPLVQQALEPILNDPSARLLDLNLATLRLSLELFGIAPQIVLASELPALGAKAELMLSLTQAAGGDVYLSGSGASAYMDDSLFDEAGLQVFYQDFAHPVFRQSHGGDFQGGCFALEWFIEDPLGARARFHEHLRTTGAQPPRCLVSEGGQG